MKPLGLKNVNMFPTADMMSNLAAMHQRWPNNTGSEERDHAYRAPLLAKDDHERKHVLNSAGAGLFARPSEYVRKCILYHSRLPRDVSPGCFTQALSYIYLTIPQRFSQLY